MSQDRVNIAAQLARDEKTRERAKQKALAKVNDIKWLMGQRPGRRIMYGLLEEAGVYRGSFTGNSETFFNEGKRAIGLLYLETLNAHCPEEFMAMLKEHKEDTDGNRDN